jgi:hypothetical protein
MASAAAVKEAIVVNIEKATMVRVLHEQPGLSEMFANEIGREQDHGKLAHFIWDMSIREPKRDLRTMLRLPTGRCIK